MKVPFLPSSTVKPTHKIFKKKRIYTKLEKLEVYNLLFKIHGEDSDIEEIQLEMQNTETRRSEAYNILFKNYLNYTDN